MPPHNHPAATAIAAWPWLLRTALSAASWLVLMTLLVLTAVLFSAAVLLSRSSFLQAQGLRRQWVWQRRLLGLLWLHELAQHLRECMCTSSIVDKVAPCGQYTNKPVS